MNKYITLFLILFLLSCQKISIDRIVKLKTIELKVGFSVIVIESEIIDPGKTGTVEYGHCWAVHSSPTINDFYNNSGITDKSISFSDTLYNLGTDTKYYVRPFAYDGETYHYGEENEFYVNISGLNIYADSFQYTGNYSSRIYGFYTGIGSLMINSAGFEWTTDSNMISGVNTIEFPEGVYTYNSELTQLTKKVPYFFRVYVSVAGGITMYSNTLSFELPSLEVQTQDAELSGNDSVYFTGNIISLSVLPAENHGICWSALTSQPTFNDDVQSFGLADEVGIYGFYKTGLPRQRWYYYRAWAFEEGHFVYGEIKSVYLP